jgi:hypothetical protein
MDQNINYHSILNYVGKLKTGSSQRTACYCYFLENANALAYATKLDGKIYAIYYSVKLDSDATGEAMQMIPKTLYMKKVERE